MKRKLSFFCSIILLLSLCTCGQKESAGPAESTGTAPAQTQTESSPADTEPQEKQEGIVCIEVLPPDGWAKNENSVLPVHYMKNTASFMVKDEPFSSTTLDDMVTEALGIYQKSFENVSVDGEAEPFTVDEKDARKLTFTCTVSEMQMKYLCVFLFAADKAYVITFGDLAENFDSLSADYDDILSNIQFQTK